MNDEQFLERFGVSREEMASWGSPRRSRGLRLRLPSGYPWERLRIALGRDGQALHERLQGDHYQAALEHEGAPLLLHLRLAPPFLEVDCEGATLSPAQLYAFATRPLGLQQDWRGLLERARALGHEQLVGDCPQLRLGQILSPFGGLLWTVIGQQINLAFACELQRRLIERYGRDVAAGLKAVPEARHLACLQAEELRRLSFSRQKASYLISLSRQVATAALPLDQLVHWPAQRVQTTLLAQRGLGRWSANYLMMRVLGFPDCVPLGDAVLHSSVQRYFKLERRPDEAQVSALLEPFAPFRTLASAHFWRLGSAPTESN